MPIRVKEKIPTIRLRHRKSKAGKKSYYMDYYVNGERKRETIGIVPLNIANQIVAKKNDDFINRRGIKVPLPDISLKEAISLHFNAKIEASEKKKTESTYRNYCTRLFDAIDKLGEKHFAKVSELTKGKFQLLVEEIRRKYPSENTANNTIKFLKAVDKTMYNRGFTAKRLTTNIVVKKPNPKLRAPFYTQEELDSIWENCSDYYRPIYQFIVSTGIRIGELINLTWDNVNLENRSIYIDVRVEGDKWSPKTKSSIRTIPLSIRALMILKELKKTQTGSDFVFVSKNGNKLSDNTCRDNLKRAIKSSGVTDKGSLHSLRHTFASLCIQSGKIDLYEVGRILGHSREDTTRIYAHLSPENSANKLDAIGL